MLQTSEHLEPGSTGNPIVFYEPEGLKDSGKRWETDNPVWDIKRDDADIGVEKPLTW